MRSTIRSLSHATRLVWLVTFPLLNLACPEPPTCVEGEDCAEDAGSLPPDFCNSRAEADSDSVHCHLVVNPAGGTERKTDVYLSRLADGGVDKDWYLAVMPPSLNSKSLLRVNAGYQVPQTGVNFRVNLLTEAGDGTLRSIATAVDKHGAAAPKPVDLILPPTTLLAGSKVYVLVDDEGADTKVHVDNRNPYSVLVEVRDNPDSHEPNDTKAQATAIAMSDDSEGKAGTSSGYLATENDEDQYVFPVTDVSGNDKNLLYVRVSGPNPHPVNPPPPYKLGYTLYDPQDRVVSEGHMENEFIRIDLATSRVTTGKNGQWRLVVKGWRSEGSQEKISGTMAVKYDVQVRVLPERDASEPNETSATAKLVSLAAPANGGSTSTQLRGKLSAVPDEEWFRLDLPSRGRPSTLRYKLTVAGAGGRFEPLSSGQLTQGPNRYVRVLAALPAGGTAQTCVSSQTVCPKSYRSASSSPEQAVFVNAWCNTPVTPLCLVSQRNAEQDPPFTAMKNAVGAVPVSAAGGTFYVLLRDEGLGTAKYADDRDWTLDVTWADDADEAGRTSASTTVALGGSMTASTGELTYGYGAFIEGFDFTSGRGIRGSLLLDYDAFETDEDLYEFTFGGATGAQGWAIEWTIDKTSGPRSADELFFELTFCTGASPGTGGSLCEGASTELFGFNAGTATPWYLDSSSASNATHLFTRTETDTAITITAEPVGCWCFSDPRVASGHFFMNVLGANRISNEPIKYALRQRLGAYPAFPSASCPGNAGVDAGTSTCNFAP